jgi:hypothetical protein
MKSVTAAKEEAPDRLTETIVSELSNPTTSSDFDFHVRVNNVFGRRWDVSRGLRWATIFLWPGSHRS